MSTFRIRVPHYDGGGKTMAVSEHFIEAAEFEVSSAGDVVFVDDEDQVVAAFQRNFWKNVCEWHPDAPVVQTGGNVDELEESRQSSIEAVGPAAPTATADMMAEPEPEAG